MAESNFFDACLELAKHISVYREGNATGVNVAYIDDSTKSLTVDEYIGGTLFVKDTTPLMLAVTDNTATRISFATLGAAPTAGVGYLLIDRDYPMDVIKGSINEALRDIYKKVVVDETLDTDSAVLEYTLPAGVSNVIKVEVETPNNSIYTAPSPVYYAENFFWKETHDGKLRFLAGKEPRLDGYAMRIHYKLPADTLSTLTTEIPAGVDFELLVWKACTHALRWGLRRYGQDVNRRVVDLLNEAQQEVTKRAGNRVSYQRDTKLGAW